MTLPTSPYKGLAPFDDSELDALLFFGREEDSTMVQANLLASRLTVLYGPSGVGKSSLLRASVARALRALPDAPRVVVFDRWGEDPGRGLAAAVGNGDAAAGSFRDVVERTQLERDVYLILDQAEEYFLYHARPTTLERDLAAVIGTPLRVNTLLSVREDALATLDRLQGRIPALYANVLRLERLDAAAARAAIVRPVERFSALTGEQHDVEPELVRVVIDEVGAGRIRHGLGGEGMPGAHDETAAGVEAPYLQLVMQRLWESERSGGSTDLRLATLERLGGARQIVADHLELAVRNLSAEQRDIASSVFTHLVTRSGAKIAHDPDDLADYAHASVDAVVPVLGSLAERRVLRRDERGRYEIFHDVLAGEVLDWRRSHEAERAVVRERELGRRRQRRLGLVAGIAVIGVALTTSLAVWALSERRHANEQATVARAAEARASDLAIRAGGAQVKAERAAKAATLARIRADRQAAAARQAEAEAKAARADADANASAAAAAEQRALDQAAVARTERDRADDQAAIAQAARKRATAQAIAAERARRDAEQSEDLAVLARTKAEQAAIQARARERLANAQALLARDPERSLQAALDSYRLDPTSPVESVLREGLLRSRLLDILPGGGGELVVAEAATSQGAPPTSDDVVVMATRRGVVRVFDRRLGALERSFDTGAPVTTAALTPDRATIAVGGRDGAVRLYAVATGGLLRTLDHVGGVLSVAFSADGRFLASAGTNETAKLWNVETGELVRRLNHPRAVRTVSFSPDGTRLVTLSSDRFVRVFDLTTVKAPIRLDQLDPPTSAAFSPDGRRIVTTGQNEVARIWEADTGKLVMELEGHAANILASAYAPAGDRVATASADWTARVWDAGTGALVLQLVGHTSFVDALTFSPDGRQILTASRDGTARLWNAISGAEQAQLVGHGGRVTGGEFGRDGRWALTASDDGTARTWSLPSDPQLVSVATGSSPVNDVAVSAGSGRVAEARADGSVNVRAADGALIVGMRVDGVATSVSLTPAGDRVLATGDAGGVSVWTVPDGVRVATFNHGAPVTAGVFLPDGQGVISVGRDGTVRFWDLATSRMRVVAREAGAVADVAISSDGLLIATAVGDVAHVRGIRGGRDLVIEGHRDAVTSVSFSPDDTRLLTTSFDHDAALWDVATGKRVKSFFGHVAVVRGAAFSPDGRWVATAGPTRAGLWEVGPSTLVDSRLYYLAGHQRAINAVAFAGTGSRIYTGGIDGSLRRYDCRLCAGTDVLVRIAATKLARLAARRAAIAEESN